MDWFTTRSPEISIDLAKVFIISWNCETEDGYVTRLYLTPDRQERQDISEVDDRILLRKLLLRDSVWKPKTK